MCRFCNPSLIYDEESNLVHRNGGIAIQKCLDCGWKGNQKGSYLNCPDCGSLDLVEDHIATP